jgi:nucleoside-diphosphate-sugar epimerase
MRVFVTGATGFIGSAVAAAFSRAGHETFGLVRSPAKSRLLEAVEVTPVAGTMEEPEAWRPVADLCSVLVHCAVDYSEKSWDLHRAVLGALRDAGRDRLGRVLLATSGVWVYGETGDNAVDESAPLDPPTYVAPRPAVDAAVLSWNGGGFRTLLIRPGCVYGGSGSLTASWFETAAKEGAARVVGDGTNHWAMVHRDDLADLYVRAAQSGLGGEVLNATDRGRATVNECAAAASRAAGAEGRVEHVPVEQAVASMGPFATCLALDQNVDSGKAFHRLGWTPRHGGFVDAAPRLHAAWRASAGDVT